MVVVIVAFHLRWFCDNGGLLRLLVNLDHPVVQASVGVPHDVVEDDQFLQLLPERLLNCGRPEASPLMLRVPSTGLFVLILAV